MTGFHRQLLSIALEHHQVHMTSTAFGSRRFSTMFATNANTREELMLREHSQTRDGAQQRLHLVVEGHRRTTDACDDACG